MTRLYVANPTVQIREMHYRLVGSTGVFKVTIPPRSQTVMPKDMTSDEIAGIIEQQEIFGMVKATDAGFTRKRIEALYSIGKEISASQIRQAIDRNEVLLQQEGLKLRQAAAIGVSQVVQDNDPSSYLGTKISIKEKSDSPEVNEFHLHRQDGDYENMGDMDTPVQAAPIKRGRGARSRRAAQ